MTAPEGRGLRIAWLGPTPTTESGATYAATQVLLGLAAQGATVDAYVPAPEEELPDVLRSNPRLKWTCRPGWWRWGRWYSRTTSRAFVSGLVARTLRQRELVREIRRRHRDSPYDVLYQFSTVELVGLRRLADQLPPIVVHPGTHAAGELRWHKAERHLAGRIEPKWRRALAGALLWIRTGVQRRDLRRVAATIASSEVFARHLAEDYGLDRERIPVAPYPINLERFRRVGSPPAAQPVTLLFVTAMSARKGVEMVVELSHRVADLAGQVRIEAIGGYRQWSDYRPLLDGLNDAIGVYRGQLSGAALAQAYRSAHGVIQPSRFEPFGLTVAEALASGLPAVTSDEVGASEFVSREVCRTFPSGDADAFEQEVRRLVRDLAGPKRERLAAEARAEAEAAFGPEHAAPRVLDAIMTGVSRQT
jgi:glycosyltransferase involved in cell wall biosynthesis